MPLHVYHKAGLEKPEGSFLPFDLNLLPIITSLIGLLLITFVAWPILSYEFKTSSQQVVRRESGLVSPIVETTQTAASPQIIGSYDYTKPQNWFPSDDKFNSEQLTTKQYTLSIPKLNIKDARVIIGGDDLDKSLIHYPNTAMPGQLGSPVIFGHSILPQFYDPENYLAIFSLLPKLENEDRIFVNLDDITYTYQVSKKDEVFPDDLWVLRQKYDSKNLKLITCVPPGLKIRRLVVTANLISN